MIKKIIYIILTILILGGSVYIATYAGIEHRRLHYRSFILQIQNFQEKPLITEEELVDTLKARFGQVEGKDLDAVPLFDIEQFLTSNPFVFTTNVYATLNGDISAIVQTRVPLLRVINYYDENFLIDTLGVVMPISGKHPVRLPVASGFIKTHYQKIPGNVNKLEEGSVLKGLFETAKLISRDDFLIALIGQIYVDENQDMEFTPKVGEHVILFGKADHAQEKLEKLKAFYHQVMKNKGWDTYKTINLTFDNQVVCSK